LEQVLQQRGLAGSKEATAGKMAVTGFRRYSKRKPGEKRKGDEKSEKEAPDDSDGESCVDLAC
jgi:hypothetical protein